MKRINIAIDGNSGSGKSSTASEVAKRLGYIYVDSGSMYRAATLYFLNNKIDINDQQGIEKALNRISIQFLKNNDAKDPAIFLNGNMVEEEIRTMEVSANVSSYSALIPVRKKMVQYQRLISKNKCVVMDGRDIGTVVMPDAELKIFLTASIEARAKRRFLEMKQKNQMADLQDIIENLEKRDLMDTTRSDSPLKKAVDAFEIDTSNLKFQDQIQIIIKKAEELINN